VLTVRRARLQFAITEDDRIVSHFGSRIALLEETLASHRFAISLNPSNINVSFNCAQVLTSIAEAGLKTSAPSTGKQDVRPLLEEAVEIFTKCLDIQQQEYEKMQAEIAKVQASEEYTEVWEGETAEENRDQEMETESSMSETPGDWATVEEPLTPESILETCTAQLDTLTTLLGLYVPATDLSTIEKRAQDGLDTATTKVPALLALIDASPASTAVPEEPKAGPTLSIGSTSAAEEAMTTPRDDAILAAANFQASVAEVQYRSGRTTSTEYAEAVERTFSSLTQAIKNINPDLVNINVHSAYADALLDLASALADGTQYTHTSPTFTTDIEIQWTALTQTQNILTHLSSASHSSHLPASRLADIFLARGDTDLFRFRLSLLEVAKAAWVKSKPTLVANAGVFYRGGRTYAEKAGAAGARGTADAKAIVAEVLREVASGSGTVKDNWKGRGEDVARVLEVMVEEGIVGQENVDGVLQMTQ
jgi:hypothetical protein